MDKTAVNHKDQLQSLGKEIKSWAADFERPSQLNYLVSHVLEAGRDAELLPHTAWIIEYTKSDQFELTTLLEQLLSQPNFTPLLQETLPPLLSSFWPGRLACLAENVRDNGDPTLIQELNPYVRTHREKAAQEGDAALYAALVTRWVMDKNGAPTSAFNEIAPSLKTLLALPVENGEQRRTPTLHRLASPNFVEFVTLVNQNHEASNILENTLKSYTGFISDNPEGSCQKTTPIVAFIDKQKAIATWLGDSNEYAKTLTIDTSTGKNVLIHENCFTSDGDERPTIKPYKQAIQSCFNTICEETSGEIRDVAQKANSTLSAIRNYTTRPVYRY